MANLMDLTLKQTLLEKFEYAMAKELTMPDPNIQMETYRDVLMDKFVVRIRAAIAGQRLESFQYPADWWEAFKERWFPQRLLKRFPVQYERREVRAYYRDIVLKPGQTHIAVYRTV
jgi:hypothetical protein